MINPYNPQLLLAWQANMDIQIGAAMCHTTSARTSHRPRL